MFLRPGSLQGCAQNVYDRVQSLRYQLLFIGSSGRNL
nr:MAG TPA_asm: hypothetical protein [Caudoviricetes sp.]